jgi:ribonucleotide reductase alpha subunit
MKTDGKVIERPIHLWFRVALFLWRDDYEKVRQVFRDFSQGKCTHATPTLFYAGARRPQMASCFLGTSLVDTLRGPVPIKDVMVGDEVITHRGRVRKVVQLHKNKYSYGTEEEMERDRRRIVKIKFANTKPLWVTEDHKLLVYNSDSEKTEWKEVGDITKKDAVMLPKYHGEMKEMEEIEEKVGEFSMNENFMVMVGIWFACGVDSEEGIYLRIPDEGNEKDNKLLDFCKHFGSYTLNKKTQYYQDLCYSQPELLSFFQQKYGSLASPKLPTDMYRFPTSFILSFMMGLGCLQRKNGKRYFSCRSESFIDSLYSLCRTRNIEIMKMESSFSTTDHYSISWEDTPLSVIRSFRKFVGFISKSYIHPKDKGEKVEKVNDEGLWDYVYTLGVEEDHSYSIEGIIAQNCFLVGTEDSVQNIFKTIGDVGQISKWAGGLGIHISNIRANRSYIYGTNGYSNGILPMIRLYNDTSRYIDQCFSGNTRILTRQGWKEIQSIQRGDQVLTATGKFHTVSRTRHYHSSKEAPLFSTCSNNNHKKQPLYVSVNHDFLVKKEDFLVKKEWIPLSDMGTNSLIQFTSPLPVVDSFWTPSRLQTLQRLYIFAIVCKKLNSENLEWSSFPKLDFLDAFDQSIATDFQKQWFFPTPTLPLSLLFAPFTPELLQLYKTLGDDFEASDHIQHWDVWTYRQKQWTVPLSPSFDVKAKEFNFQRVHLEDTIDLYDLEIEKVVQNGSISPDGMYVRDAMDVVGREDWSSSYVTEIGTVHNGGGKRNGAFAMYIEPWHADIMEFIHAKKNTGPEEIRARDLFYGLWIPDLFMKRVQEDSIWSLMCPSQSPDLYKKWGKEFEDLYVSYEKEGKFVRQLPARELWKEIIKSQIETGTPYILYKDACNRKSNQQNIGTIRSSNLCVSGHTRILTKEYGYIAIEKLVNQHVSVWNGQEYELVKPVQTGVTLELFQIEFSDGSILECTPYHNFFMTTENGLVVKLKAHELKIGNILESYSLPCGNVSDYSGEWQTTIKSCLEFISAKSLLFQDYLYLNSPCRHACQEMKLVLQSLGIPSQFSWIDESLYQLRIPFEYWNQYKNKKFSESFVSPRIENVRVRNISRHEFGEEKPVYCFNASKRERGMFEGIVCGNCTEIIEYSDEKEYAVCNLGSIALPRYIKPNPALSLLSSPRIIVVKKQNCVYCQLLISYFNQYSIEYTSIDSENNNPFFQQLNHVHKITTYPAVFFQSTENENDRLEYQGGFQDMWKKYLIPIFDHEELKEVVQRMTSNLNRVIDLNVYPVPETEKSNRRHRPIGLGVQGLADVFCQLRLEFDETEARKLNREIFETIYFAALSASHTCAMTEGAYESFQGSPLSQGRFHFDLCSDFNPSLHLSGRWDWEELRIKIRDQGGVRNSLLVAPMPTASTSQILGNNECFEPFTSNLYLRRTSVGEFYVSNDYLLQDLRRLEKKSKDVQQKLLATKGSIQSWNELPDGIRRLYRTVWEIPQKSLIEMAWERHFFIDQSQSLNLFVETPTLDKLTKMHFYTWSKGLKTGCYYMRSRGGVASVSIAVDPASKQQNNNEEQECLSCSA